VRGCTGADTCPLDTFLKRSVPYVVTTFAHWQDMCAK
jgi:hypothetical protein